MRRFGPSTMLLAQKTAAETDPSKDHTLLVRFTQPSPSTGSNRENQNRELQFRITFVVFPVLTASCPLVRWRL